MHCMSEHLKSNSSIVRCTFTFACLPIGCIATYVANTKHNNIDPCVQACFDRVDIQTAKVLCNW